MTLETDCPPRPSDDATGSPSGDETDLTPDQIFHILQTERRREVIRYMLDEDGPVKMRDIAESVAARENDVAVDELTSPQRQRVYIPLYQSHLPKLDRAGVIEYEQSRGIVRPADRLATFRAYIEVSETESVESTDDSGWLLTNRANGVYYVIATALSTSLLLTTATGLLAIPGLTLGAIITGLFTLVTAFTTVFDRFSPQTVRAP